MTIGALGTGIRFLVDGFGNLETLVGIENVFGTYLGDVLRDNGAANELYGDAGSDTLNGGAGVDTLTGGTAADAFVFESWDGGNPFGDRITDFRSGTDSLVFVTEDFAGMDGTLRFVNGTSAGGAGQSWFFFDTVTDRLFWDQDGTGGSAAVLVATLVGVNTLTAADFDLI